MIRRRHATLDHHGDFARSPQAVRLAWAGAVKVCARPPARAEKSGWRALALVLGLLLASAWTAAAWGEETELACLGCAAPVAADAPSGWRALPVQAGQCIRLANHGGREVLVNACKDCRSVQVSRKRPGPQPASSRSYTLTGESQMPLPFLGPGQTRVSSETACGGDEQQAKTDDRQCVSMHNTDDHGMVLVNACPVCRKVDFERIHADGDRTTQIFTIPRNGYVPAPSHGARYAHIVGDEPCRQ